MSNAYHELVNLRSIYLDEGFNALGADYILPDDVVEAGFDFSHTELEAAISTMVEQLDKFFQGQTVTAEADYDKVMNLVYKVNG